MQIFPQEWTQMADLGKKLLIGDCNLAKSMVFLHYSIGHKNGLREGRNMVLANGVAATEPHWPKKFRLRRRNRF